VPVPPTHETVDVRIIGERPAVVHAAEAIGQVLDVAYMSLPRKNRPGRRNEPGVRIYAHASGVRDVTVMPTQARAEQLPGGAPAGYAELGEQLQAMAWYPLHAGDVVLVDLGPYGGQTYQAYGADPSSTTAFTCPRCCRVSQHPADITAGYCGACHDWTGDTPALRMISDTADRSLRPPPYRMTCVVSFVQLWFDEWDATLSVVRGGQTLFIRPALSEMTAELAGGDQ
jgi:hypothetical protein